MAPEDRNFEKALARHLRSEATQPSVCADAETLAAYHERLLAPHELASWKQHIASCARCQEILAQLEITDEIPVDSIAEHDALVVAIPAREHAVAAQATAPRQTAEPVQIRPSTTSTAKPRRTSWRLLVPAGALAAGLIIWIVSREDLLQQRILEPSPSPARVSDAASAPAAPSVKAQPESVQANEERAKSPGEPKAKPQLTMPAPPLPKAEGPLSNERAPAALANAARPNEALSSDLRKDAPLRSRAGAAVGPSNRALQQQAANNVYQNGQAPELKRDRRVSDQLDKDSGAAVAGALQPAPPAPPAAAGYAAAAPAPVMEESQSAPSAKKLARREANARLLAEPQTVIVTGEAAMFAASMSVVGGQRVLPVQGTKIIWKIDDDGRVRRTTDAGESWKEQDTGVSATLFSGSAPSEKVCWLVGTFGTVLLTTDGGIHWNKVAAPIHSTIDRIEATDARHAVVTLQSSTVQFETFDAGQTWSLIRGKK